MFGGKPRKKWKVKERVQGKENTPNPSIDEVTTLFKKRSTNTEDSFRVEATKDFGRGGL